MHRIASAALVGILVATGGVVAIAGSAGAHDLAWVRQFGTPASDDVKAVQIGPGGAVSVAGTSTGPGVVDGQPLVRRFDLDGELVSATDLGPGAATAMGFSADGGVIVARPVPSSQAGGGTDVLVQRYDSSLNEVWSRRFGTEGSDRAQAVASAPDGAVYVAGLTDGRFQGEGPTGSADAFVRKYDAGGSHEWTRQFGEPADGSRPGHEDARGVAVDQGGDVLVTGTAQGVFGDAYLRRFDATGAELWARQFGVSTSSRGNGVAVDGEGNAYVVGSGGPAFRALSDAFVRKYDRHGTLLWERISDTPSASPDPRLGTVEEGNAVTVDADGRVVMAGSTNGTFEGQESAGFVDAFVRSYDPAGELLWTRQLGTPQIDRATAVAPAGDGAVHVAGTTAGDLAGENAGGTDGFVARFDAPAPQGADLAVTVDATQRNKVVTYTITVANLGPGTATDVVLVDWFPARGKLVSVVTSQGDCLWTQESVWCPVGELASGASATLHLVVKTATREPVANVVGTTAPEVDPDPDNNWATTITDGLKRR